MRRSKLVGLTGVVETNFATTIYYKVPFQQALPLVGKRDVYLENGFAFVPFTVCLFYSVLVVLLLSLPLPLPLTLSLSLSLSLTNTRIHDIQRVISLIIQRFRMNLSKALAEAASTFEKISADSRIGPLLKNMNKMYAGKDFTKGSGSSIDKLTPDQVSTVHAYVYTPICI